MSTTHLIPEDIADLYLIKEWRNATGVLAAACPEEWEQILTVLREFKLLKSEIIAPDG